MEQLIEVGMGLITPAILGVVGFLWKVNSKLTALEKQVEAQNLRISSNAHKLNQHFEKAFTIRKDS